MEQLGEVTQAVLACVAFGNVELGDPRKVAALVAVRSSLATIFGVYARGLESEGSHTGWTADRDNPGYLQATVKGVGLRAPWHMIADLPGIDALEEAVGHAAKVRFAGDSVICLSGSMAARGGVLAASDIDLCEYISAAHDFASVSKQALATSDAVVVCVQIGAHVADGLTAGFAQIRRPWTAASSQAFLDGAAGAAVGKCDFALVSRVEGTIELTKIVLHVDARYPDTEGAWDLSFPYQEVALDTGAWVPRRLASPRSLGKYVAWLFRQVETYAAGAPWKAAKRALSLARILHVPALADRARRILRHEDLALKAVLRARVEFHRRLATIDDPAVEPFRRGLEATILQLAGRLGIQAGGTGERPDRSIAAVAARLPEISGKSADMDGLVADFRAILEPSLQSGRYY
jgi:hypothetical protein